MGVGGRDGGGGTAIEHDPNLSLQATLIASSWSYERGFWLRDKLRFYLLAFYYRLGVFNCFCVWGCGGVIFCFEKSYEMKSRLSIFKLIKCDPKGLRTHAWTLQKLFVHLCRSKVLPNAHIFESPSISPNCLLRKLLLWCARTQAGSRALFFCWKIHERSHM